MTDVIRFGKYDTPQNHKILKYARLFAIPSGNTNKKDILRSPWEVPAGSRGQMLERKVLAPLKRLWFGKK
ncbi:hypothetical protein DKG77_12390 [Flagellimonas aquimarina]|uniref:Uncharacterized protein n=1 Tax=Flagellimonas aquimarina TaxID=2201895 RepID=A0A316L113_9FLAO|nr:hypothetical protein [Allomuricauda koreensis]PWL39018.1 hypothetical protein DKG77_12390 [Allomuricauda koreensis]